MHIINGRALIGDNRFRESFGENGAFHVHLRRGFPFFFVKFVTDPGDAETGNQAVI